MCNIEFDMFRSYHVVDPTTVALILRSGIALFMKSACCLWTMFGGTVLLIEFLGRRASWLSRAHRIAGDTRLAMHRTGWLLRRILAPMLAALLLLSGAASGNDQVLQKPLSKSVAADWSGSCTLLPFVVGLVGRAAMHKNNPISPLPQDCSASVVWWSVPPPATFMLVNMIAVFGARLREAHP